MLPFYKTLDGIICRNVKSELVQDSIKEAEIYKDTPAIQETHTEYVSLDTKSSALFTHLSLMIAAISVLKSSGPYWLQTLFAVQIAYNAFVLLIILRVIHYSYYRDHEEASRNLIEKVQIPDNWVKNKYLRAYAMMEELMKRMVYYRRAHFLVIIGNTVLMLSLIIEAVWYLFSAFSQPVVKSQLLTWV